MRDGQQRGTAVHRVQPFGRAAVELQLRRSAAAHDLEMTPEHAVGMPGPERFHAGFLCREPGGEVDRRDPVALTIRDLVIGEDAAQKSLAVALDCGGDAVDVRRIDSNPDDVRHAPSAY